MSDGGDKNRFSLLTTKIVDSQLDSWKVTRKYQVYGCKCWCTGSMSKKISTCLYFSKTGDKNLKNVVANKSETKSFEKKQNIKINAKEGIYIQSVE